MTTIALLARLAPALALLVTASVHADVDAARAWTLAQPLASTELPTPAARAGHRIQVDAGVFDAPTLQLVLPGASVTAERSTLERRPSGLLWRGHVEGDPDHPVTLTLHDGQLAGLLSLAEGSWEILPDAAGSAFLVQLDHSRYPECSGADPVASDDPAPRVGTDPAFRDRPEDIDVIVFYTAAARDGAGGVAQIQTTAQAAVDNSNTAFAQSNLPHRYTMVAALELPFVESGNSGTDLSAFRASPIAQAARNEYLADQAGLLVENGGGGCGRGYLMTNVGPGFAANAFQITARTCAVGNLTYAHEHGHNMGMHHNPEDAGPAAFTYSYGHGDNSGATAIERFRTVLSYATPCPAPNTCTRRPYLSSPLVEYMGRPTGIADQRDNARNMREVADTVANWRTKTLLRHGFE